MAAAGPFKLEVRASAESATTFEVTEGGGVLATIAVPVAGYTTTVSTLELAAGRHTLRVKATGGRARVNWMQFLR